MYRIAVEALTLARKQGWRVLLSRVTRPNAWRRLLYGSLQLRDWKPIIAQKYLVGSGLEIGALHKPLPVSAAAQVTYVDRLSIEGLRAHYPELSNCDFVDVDIVDDGEVLSTVPAASQDFIIANHCLEHCENPLGTIRTHLEKLKPEGLLFYTIPDRNMTFDWKRPNTSFDHLVRDDVAGPEASRAEHYEEWVRLVLGKSDGEASPASQLMAEKFSIHFHCWDKDSFRSFLESARSYLGNQFSIVEFRPNGPETVVVLRQRAVA